MKTPSRLTRKKCKAFNKEVDAIRKAKVTEQIMETNKNVIPFTKREKTNG